MHAEMLTSTPTILPPMRNPITIAQALMFLERHGHSPIMTPDGILVVAEVTVVPRCGDDYWNCEEGDQWFEEPNVFPIVGNVVDLAPIREWQGY